MEIMTVAGALIAVFPSMLMIALHWPGSCCVAQVVLNKMEVMFVYHAVTVKVTGQERQTEGVFYDLKVENRQGINQAARHQLSRSLEDKNVIPRCAEGPVVVGMQADRKRS